MNTLFPVFLKLENLHTLLVGGGNVGLEKLSALLANSPQARVTVVADRFLEELIALAGQHSGVRLVHRCFEWADLEGTDLVILATDNPKLHKEIKAITTQKHILTNVADTPDLCDMYLGSIVQKGDLKVAISTNGKSPTLAKRIKELLNEVIPSDIQQTLNQLEAIRKTLKGDFQAKIKALNEITKGMVE